MKTFLILLAVGLAACDKLDRTYLPPPGAQYAGGNLGHLDVPLEPPHPGTDSGMRQDVLQDSFKINGEPASFGDKIPKAPPSYYPGKVPTTTTSYAFTQTTTFPPESYETTALPINPVTGLPVVFDQANNPGFNQGYAVPTYGTNVQPGSISQSPSSGTYNNPSYTQSIDQPLNQYPGRNVEVPGEIVQIPGPNKGASHYPSGQIPNAGQQGLIQIGAVNDQGQNVVSPGVAIQQYPDEQILGKPEFPSTTAPQNINSQPGKDYGVNYPGIQNAYSGQPINVYNLGEPQHTQAYQHQEPMSVGGHQIVVGSEQVHPGLTPTSSYPSRQHLISRPERPQAAADRNAVILNYVNERTPNTYSYSYDTSNGIHADESGVVDNGTKAQGSYSYTGDDGKVYSVYYTADENGFQPRGDHLPTPPPIPEAIKRVIEQAARDKAAGIFDDGSYDEEKYGDKKYRNPASRRRPQNPIDYKPFNEEQNGLIKPIAGINVAEDNQSIFQDLLPNTGTRRVPSEKTTRNEDMDVMIGNRRISVNNDNIPSVGKIGSNQFKEMPTKGNNARVPITVAQKGPEDEPSQFGSKNRGSFKSPSSGSLRNKYSESKVDSNSPSDYSETDYDETGDRDFETDALPSEPTGKVDNVNNISTRKQSLSQKPKGNQPSITDYINNAVNQPSSEVETGYYYQQPNTTFGQTIFPTRFSTPATSTTLRPNQRQNESQNEKTLKPFITPNIYDQNNNNYQSTTRRPFTTVGVTSPDDKSYTDYDDDDYQSLNQDNNDDRIDSTKVPASQTDVTSRPYSKQTLGPKYIPTGQSQDRKEILIPARTIDNSSTRSPGISYGSTTPMPSHTSRFGVTNAPRRMRPNQRRPIKPFSGSIPSDDTYPITERISGYSDPSIVPSHITGVVPGFDSVSSIPGISSTQNYPTSTYRPGNGYSSITGAPQSPVYGQGTGSEVISPYSSHSGYHYEPPKTDYTSDFFKPSGTSEVSPTSPPGFNQNIYLQDPVSPSSTTLAPTTPGRTGTFILTQPGNSLPVRPYETNHENGPSTPNYSTTVPSSTPGLRPGFVYPGSSLEPNDHTISGYVYRRPTPPFSTTVSPSTYGPTPTSYYISSETPGVPNQGYSTTYRPAVQTTKATAIIGPLVDGFGRPIPSGGGTTYPGYTTFTQDITRLPVQDSGFIGSQYDAGRPIDNLSIPSGHRLVNDLVPGFNGGQTSTAYPEPVDHTRVIGEDFSGPKQPQRYDPKTGYHYK